MGQIDRLRMMANEAISQYGMETALGGDPPFPQWATDLLEVCVQAESVQRLGISGQTAGIQTNIAG